MRTYESGGKRALDLVVASIASVVVAPIAILIGLAIRLEDGPPIFFKQTRVGRDGACFQLLKFRSMPVNSNKQVPSSEAGTLTVTRLGRVLRRTNIDELPQLLNIIRGDMSLVGPRPPLTNQTDLIALRKESGSLALRPGLTGLAQVNSYNGMPIAEKAEWDARYAQLVSVLVDVNVILKTFRYLLKTPPAY